MGSTSTRFDQQDVYGSTVGLPRQLDHAWTDCQKVDVPESYRRFDRVVIAGMGGSGLGGRIIDSIYGLSLSCPLILVNDYQLPDWVDRSTLVICSSYSGNTEETLANFNQARQQQAKIMVIAAGGELLKLAQENHLPHYQIDPVYNPSRQPRMAIGYSVVGQLVLAAKAGLLTLDRSEIDAAIAVMKTVLDRPETCRQLAEKLVDKQVIFAAAGHLTGPAHTVKNQMNENAKHLAHRHDLPELNHHLMEGLGFPAANPQTTLFWLIDSGLYLPRLRRRLALTQEVVEKNKLATFVWTAVSKTKLAQAFELIQFGALVNFDLSQLHRLDPAPVPWVDYFKQHLQPL